MLKDFVCRALREKLAGKHGSRGRSAGGWRTVFGKAKAADVAEADRAMEAAFERIDPADWK